MLISVVNLCAKITQFHAVFSQTRKEVQAADPWFQSVCKMPVFALLTAESADLQSFFFF